MQSVRNLSKQFSMTNCTKVSYKSRRVAKQSAHCIKLKGAILPRENLIPYLCQSCKAYHLSKSDSTEYLNKVAKYNKQNK